MAAALQAAHCLRLGDLRRKAEVHFLEVVDERAIPTALFRLKRAEERSRGPGALKHVGHAEMLYGEPPAETCIERGGDYPRDGHNARSDGA